MTQFELPRPALESLAGPMTELQAGLMTAFGRAVIEASGRVNLVSRRSLGRLGEHIVDSAALLSVRDGWRGELGDLGSGGGLPGIVIGILRPALRVALVEGRRNKVVFLRDVVRRLELGNVRVIHGRLESLAGTEQFEVATARALGEIEDVLEVCLRLVRPGGDLVLFKGPGWARERGRAEEIAAARQVRLAESREVGLPGYGRTTTFAVFHVEQPGTGTP